MTFKEFMHNRKKSEENNSAVGSKRMAKEFDGSKTNNNGIKKKKMLDDKVGALANTTKILTKIGKNSNNFKVLITFMNNSLDCCNRNRLNVRGGRCLL